MNSWITPETRAFFKEHSEPRKRLKSRYSYYHEDNLQFFQDLIQADSRVLVIGCEVEDMAQGLRAAEVHLVDLSDTVNLQEKLAATDYDYIILPYTLQFLENIQVFLDVLRAGMRPKTRLVVLQYNFLWAPVFKAAERLGLKSPTPDLNWLSVEDVQNLLDLTHLQKVRSGTRCLVPFGWFGLSYWINTYVAPLPGLRWLCQKSYAIVRPAPHTQPTNSPLSVSVVVPARNEAGNIEPLITRLPELAPGSEIIFVEGHSKDQTWETIQQQIQNHPRRGTLKMTAFQQTGVGKADAVRLGFSKATGDVLMILDADISVRPEDLGLFYQALTTGAAEFVNGSRLIYKMERHAMQVLNLFFNKLFGMWLSWLIDQPVKDTLCGTKAILRKDYERLRKAYPRWSELDPFGDFELLFGAGRLSLKICDVPVWYKQRTYGSTNISRFRHGWELLRMCLLSWAELKR